MRGIILAGGRGARLGGLTQRCPKSLVKLLDIPLIDYVIRAMRSSGIEEIAIVTGYRAHEFNSYSEKKFHNSKWKENNIFGGLLCANEWLNQYECIVSYADIFYNSSFIKPLLNTESDLALAYDPDWLELWSKRFKRPEEDAETFSLQKGNVFLAGIGEKIYNLSNVEGQYIGLFKITPKGWGDILEVMSATEGALAEHCDMTQVFRCMLSDEKKIEAVAVSGPWGEVDNESDLRLYEEMFFNNDSDEVRKNVQ